MAECLAELSPSDMWRAEVVNDEIVHLTTEMSKQSVEDEAWFLAAYSKMVEGKDKLSKNY